MLSGAGFTPTIGIPFLAPVQFSVLGFTRGSLGGFYRHCTTAAQVIKTNETLEGPQELAITTMGMHPTCAISLAQ
jgi:hypothetical protein